MNTIRCPFCTLKSKLQTSGPPRFCTTRTVDPCGRTWRAPLGIAMTSQSRFSSMVSIIPQLPWRASLHSVVTGCRSPWSAACSVCHASVAHFTGGLEGASINYIRRSRFICHGICHGFLLYCKASAGDVALMGSCRLLPLLRVTEWLTNTGRSKGGRRSRSHPGIGQRVASMATLILRQFKTLLARPFIVQPHGGISG